MGVIKLGVLASILVLASACSEKANQCGNDSDCTNPAFPFCDVNADYPASGGEKNVCTIVPSDCPVERCGCDKGATSCSEGVLVTCAADGKSTTSETCALGCAPENNRCLTFDPANGLGPALVASATDHDVVIPAGSTIDTDLGEIRDNANVIVSVTSSVVTQNGPIRVFAAKSFSISSVTVHGTNSLAFVAIGPITVKGLIDASATGATSGPGGLRPVNSAGLTAASDTPALTIGGGGGNATNGGDGECRNLGNLTAHAAGGVADTGESAVGGGVGGGTGGGGGGGVTQMASLTKIDVSVVGTDQGAIDVGGGGGLPTGGIAAGGGAGGLVILEAPTVGIGGAVTANGGGGSACGMAGQDGARSTIAATGASCGTTHGGAGGTGLAAPGGGSGVQGGGGGGGSAGRLIVNTLSGSFGSSGAQVISAVTTSGSLSLR